MKSKSIRSVFALTIVLSSYSYCIATDVQFSRDVLPILSDRCFHCHGPDADHREAGLRLDQRESAIDEMASVVPGEPNESELIHRVTTDDADLLMPPPNSHRKPLTKIEVEILRQWIADGAQWGKHWSFEKLSKPEIDDTDLGPIDVFIQRRLKREGLEPSPEADPRALIRRVTLDLTGLPPTISEVEAFVKDDSPNSYKKLIDRLLSSKHYGERMAWPWLDAARYADTSGYQGDPERSMWPWRDWVIDAFNDNMPFDQFTIEQLAGDLLNDATPEQRLASGFNRNHMHNGEGGRIPEETRVENVFDRTETTGTVWLGLTLQCARCHDHKFDPTSNKDYFAFYDFFNQTSESGRINRSLAVPPSMDYRPKEHRETLREKRQTVASLTSLLLAPSKEADVAQVAWEAPWKDRRADDWHNVQPVTATSIGGATIDIKDDSILQVTGKNPDKDVYEITARANLENITVVRLEALIDPTTPSKSTGRGSGGNFVLSEIELFTRSTLSKDRQKNQIKFIAANASFEQGNLVAARAIDGNLKPNNGWAPSAHTRIEPSHATFVTEKPVEMDGETELVFRLHFESMHKKHTLAKFRLSVTGAKQPDAVDVQVRDVLAKPAKNRSDQEVAKLREHFRFNHWPGTAKVARQLSAARTDLAKWEESTKPVKVMVMDSLDQPRETLVLVKGIYNSPTDRKVTANVPSMLPRLPEKKGKGRYSRLDLARWIVSPENPLTPRVIVNQFWQILFGRGIVSTPSDFGLQGRQPSHPELLDWLAVDFVESGWNVKRLIRTIVTSHTYRQSARVSQEMLQTDPDNELLARSSRNRMPSWMIRDMALATSGLLNRGFGGPPAKSYQPNGIWAEATFGKIKYQIDEGDKLYRRSLYSFWRRIVGPTVFFDSAKRQTCEVKQNLTNTPLHALTTLNDVTYVEAARVMAERMILVHDSDHDRIVSAFALLTSRSPEPDELVLLKQRLASTLDHFRSDPEAADRLLSVGQSLRNEAIDPTVHASFTTLINTLMNLDEVLVRP